MTGFNPPANFSVKMTTNVSENTTQYNLHTTALPESVSPTVSVILPNAPALVDLVEEKLLTHGLPILVTIIIGLFGIFNLCKRYPSCFYVIVAIAQFAWLVFKTPFLLIHQKLCPRRYRGAPPSNGDL